MQETPIQKIPESFKQSNYHLKLLKRLGDIALYGDESRSCYEVHVVKVAKPTAVFNRHYPAREVLAGNEEFGERAWAYSDLERAENRFAGLVGLIPSPHSV